MSRNVVIFGGSQTETFKKQGQKRGLKVEHHNGLLMKNEAHVKREFSRLIKNSDVVIVLLGAIAHRSMWLIKSLAKDQNKKIAYCEGFGASGALAKAEQLIR